MIHPSQIKPHMEVFNAEGAYVGLAVGVAGGEIELAAAADGEAPRRIPLALVDYAWDHKLKLIGDA